MKREWTDLEFADWTLLPSEAALLANKTRSHSPRLRRVAEILSVRCPLSFLDAGSADDCRRLRRRAGGRPGRGVLTL
jgi:hypothetical protein